MWFDMKNNIEQNGFQFIYTSFLMDSKMTSGTICKTKNTRFYSFNVFLSECLKFLQKICEVNKTEILIILKYFIVMCLRTSNSELTPSNNSYLFTKRAAWSDIVSTRCNAPLQNQYCKTYSDKHLRYSWGQVRKPS